MAKPQLGPRPRREKKPAGPPVSLKQIATGGPAPADHPYPYPWVRLRYSAYHPLIYRRMVSAVDPAVEPGDLVAVYDRQDGLIGHGLFHDRSQIAVRLLSRKPKAIDDAFWRDRLERAVTWRGQLIASDEQTEACRLVHAEGDGLSGLVAERYGDWIAIELFSLGIYRQLDRIKRLLSELTGITQFVVRVDRRISRLEDFDVPPEASDEGQSLITIRENGLRFKVDLRAGQKTGFFCDQRDNRRRLAAFCPGRSVLDVCCYTGGFGIYAARLGQAASVVGVDLDEDAIALARKNAHLNETRIQHVHADAFSYVRQMHTNGRTFDVVVLDPPKFVPTREDVETGRRKYLDLNALAMSVIKPGGLLLSCSCSGLVSREDFARVVKSASDRAARPLQIVDQSGAAPDHPVMADCPESEYLKAIWARVG